MTTINALSNAIYHFPPPIVSITHEKSVWMISNNIKCSKLSQHGTNIL